MGRKRKNWATDTKVQAYVEDFDLSFYATSIHPEKIIWLCSKHHNEEHKKCKEH